MVMVGGEVWVRVAVKVAVLVLPAASRAWTVSMFVPIWRPIPLAVQLVVPVAVPLPPRLFVHVTWVTPTLSEAVPPNVMAWFPVAFVAPGVGGVWGTVGVVVVWGGLNVVVMVLMAVVLARLMGTPITF